MDLLWPEVPQPGHISRPKDNPALHLADSGHSCDPSMSVVNEWAGPLEVDLFMDGSESFRGRTHPKGQQSWTLKFSSVTKLPLLSKAHGLWGLFLCFILQCLGLHKRQPEFPVGTRESRRNSRKTT